jgi:hypothetical protein
MAPAAMMTSLRAVAVYRAELPFAGANSTPEAVNGMLELAHLIFVTWVRNEMISRKLLNSLE